MSKPCCRDRACARIDVAMVARSKATPAFPRLANARMDGKYVKIEKIQSYLQNCNALGGKLCELARKRLADYGVPDPGFACHG
jgi:hypothetical protein